MEGHLVQHTRKDTEAQIKEQIKKSQGDRQREIKVYNNSTSAQVVDVLFHDQLSLRSILRYKYIHRLSR